MGASRRWAGPDGRYEFQPSLATAKQLSMYVHTRTLSWIAKRGVLPAPRQWRRAVYTTGFALAYGALVGTVSIARWLDGLFYPEFRRTPIQPPLFVVATPRSGTTYLHHLLSLDSDRFVSFRLYQTLAPSILLDRCIGQLAELDAETGLGLAQLVDAIDNRMFTDWDHIHRVGLRAYEEDENLFVYSLATPALYLLIPCLRQLPELANIESFGRRAVERLASDYRESVQRLVYLSGGTRVPLLKTVLFPSRLSVVDAAFPEARYVHVVRDPMQAIPSAVSMFHTMWQAHSPHIEATSADTRALAKMFVDHYGVLSEQRASLPAERCTTVHYEALVNDPVGSVERIYRAFGLPLSTSFVERLAAAARAATRFRSRHQYQLERFGLTPADIESALFYYRRECDQSSVGAGLA